MSWDFRPSDERGDDRDRRHDGRGAKRLDGDVYDDDDDFPPPIHRKPLTWALAMLGLRRPPRLDDMDHGTEDPTELRVRVRRALIQIDEGKLYTIDAVRQLAHQYYKDRAETFRKASLELNERIHSGRLSDEQRKVCLTKREQANTCAEYSRQAAAMFKRESMTVRMKRLMRRQPPRLSAYGYPSRVAIQRLFEYFKESGFLGNPVPVNDWIRSPHVTTAAVYAAKDREMNRELKEKGSKTHFFYHGVRSEIGGKPARVRYEDLVKLDKDTNAEVLPGAVYTTYVYDEPYLKKGIFIIYPRKGNEPAQVKLINRWESPAARHMTGRDLTGPGSGKSALAHVNHGRSGNFVETHDGYIFDQGFDFYIFLFGPNAYAPQQADDRTRRISTIYVDGTNRSGAVLNKVMGSILAFDSGPKGEIMFQRVVMYRYADEFTKLDGRADEVVAEILSESRRFDINDPDELILHERAYREIFMDLGFEATQVKDPDDQRTKLEVRRIVQPISDQSPMEIIFDR